MLTRRPLGPLPRNGIVALLGWRADGPGAEPLDRQTPTMPYNPPKQKRNLPHPKWDTPGKKDWSKTWGPHSRGVGSQIVDDTLPTAAGLELA